MLIGVHSGFILLFFLAIIVVVVYKLSKRKKSKISSSGSLPRSYSAQNSRSTVPQNEKRIYPKPSKPKIYDNEGKLSSDPPLLKKEDEKITNLMDKTKTMPKPECFTRSEESNAVFSDDEYVDSFSDDSPNLSTSTEPPVNKNIFDRYYWDFRSDQSFQTKKLKFERAIEYCKENNLGSKAKLRRLKMKIDRWSVENERDVEAMIPEYESLLDLIEEFENL